MPAHIKVCPECHTMQEAGEPCSICKYPISLDNKDELAQKKRRPSVLTPEDLAFPELQTATLRIKHVVAQLSKFAVK